MRYTIYIKLTNCCNLRCKHCYNDMVHNSVSMSKDILNSSIKAIDYFAKTHLKDDIDIQIHGGEPLLYDIHEIDRLIDSLQCDNIHFGITTNLVNTNIDDNYISVFRKIKPDGKVPCVTTSWDKEIRFTGDQEKLWLYNVKNIVLNGITVQPIVCVTNIITKEDPEILFASMHSIGIKHMNFERITLSGRAKNGELKPSNREVDDWLMRAYVINECKYNMDIPLFDSIENSIDGFFLGCRARMCMRTVITINPDGSLSACPNTADYTTGKIIDNRFSFEIDKLRCIVESENSKRKECLMCKYFRYCKGDCCQLKFDDSGCPGLIKIYNYLTSQKSS